MPKVNPHKNPMLGNFLWWLAVAILAVGGTIIYLIHQDSIGSQVDVQTNQVALVMIVGIGLILICGTAKRWMKR